MMNYRILALCKNYTSYGIAALKGFYKKPDSWGQIKVVYTRTKVTVVYKEKLQVRKKRGEIVLGDTLPGLVEYWILKI